MELTSDERRRQTMRLRWLVWHGHAAAMAALFRVEFASWRDHEAGAT